MWPVSESLQPYGPRWYQWKEKEGRTFEACIKYELEVLRELITSGHQACQNAEGL